MTSNSDLVKRLRALSAAVKYGVPVADEAADALAAAEITHSVADAWEKGANDWMIRATSAEAKLAKAREALAVIAAPVSMDDYGWATERARAALKEIDDAT